MDFLGIGYQELLLVLVLLLVVVGPERLPGMAYQIGRAVRQMQRYARAVRDEFRDEFDYIEEQYRTVRGEIDTTRGAVREQQAKFESDMRAATGPLNEPLLPVEPAAASTNGTSAQAAAAAEVAPEPAATPESEREPGERPPLVF